MTTAETDRGLRRWRLAGVVASLVAVQSMAAALPQPGHALMLLPSEGPVAGLGDGLRRGFVLALEDSRRCGLSAVQWSVGWVPPDADPAPLLAGRRLPPVLLAPPATPLVETGLLARNAQRQVLLTLQRGASLQQLATRPGSDRLWPVAPARTLEIDALVKSLSDADQLGFLLVTDGTSDQQLLADRFLEGMRAQGGVLLGPDVTARVVDPSKPEDLKLLGSDAEWFRPSSVVVMTGPDTPLMKAVLKQTWPKDVTLVWPVPPRQRSERPQIGVDEASRGPGWKAFEKGFRQRWGYTPSVVEASGYDAGQLVALSAASRSQPPGEGLKGFDPTLGARPLCEAIKARREGRSARPQGVASNMDMKPATPPTATLEVIEKKPDGARKTKNFNLGAS
ncbi:MAG: histidine kinase [Synechococcus sp. Tobar2m-G35]|nr:histidine kinase [Synechococcus sp. Tobar2m-G35]